MRDGWRRCDAEGIDVVRLALRDAADPEQARSQAIRAGKALAAGPVLAGAVHQLSGDEDPEIAALRLLVAAPEEHKTAIARLAHGLSKAVLAERWLEQRYLESLGIDELDEVLD